MPISNDSPARVDIGRQKKGKRTNSDLINELARRAEYRQAQAAQTGNATEAPRAGFGQTRQFKVVAIFDDYITARTTDGTTDGTAIISIMRPYTLRVSLTARGGVSYAKVSSQERIAGGTEAQVLTPQYLAGDIIYADRFVGGLAETDDLSVPIRWIDKNVDGRQWAKKAGT